MKPPADIVEPEILRDLVSYRIRLVQIAAFKQFEAVLAGFGTAPRYFGMLAIIEANPGIPQSRLAEAIFLERASLVPILDAMEREGIVRREGSPADRRLRCVSLTDDGKALLEALKPHVARHEARMVAGLSARERGALIRLLRRVEDNLAAAATPPRKEKEARG